jgi:hypothetical protein
MGKGIEHQEINVDEVIIDVVEVVGLSVAEHSLENMKKYIEHRPNDPLTH